MPDTRIRKTDIEREREILLENVDEYPALQLLLDQMPDAYDPDEPLEDRDAPEES